MSLLQGKVVVFSFVGAVLRLGFIFYSYAC